MLTYDLQNVEGPLYLHIYQCLKNDITEGKLQAHEKLPSKRTFANNNGISTITIQNAYDQLISEGYIYTVPKKGYYVSDIAKTAVPAVKAKVSYDIHVPKKDKGILYDLSYNGTDPENFPFSVWAKVSREVMSNCKTELMTPSPAQGIKELREAIAGHLHSFRGMLVDPNQIIVGAGTEYLYGIIVKLLGEEKTYAIENPGYKKLVKIYGEKGIECKFASMDEKGVMISQLNEVKADVAHICPNHHFPTGLTMPASRRYDVLAWANERSERYIIEDDYDSEFRSEGRPIPTLFSIDGCEKVIYINTFSKSLTPTIRISYMVLPVHLANRFYENMSFLACTVSNFEQYTLAHFIKQGYFEKHINRMRLFYMRQRKSVIDVIKKSALGERCSIRENDAGLHFLLKVDFNIAPRELNQKLLKRGIKINALEDYYLDSGAHEKNLYIVNYSMLNGEKMKKILGVIEEVLNN
ncbi:MAG: PLP-dependent aminotransferase family protein [Lachnospiraceae bacterium]|nr:PLP-dependent aminotransferase family protein [Lachnospiraceae bacterium]